MSRPPRAKSFAEFWPYYVGEHRNAVNRRFHFFGTSLTFLFVVLALATGQPLWLLGMPIGGYGFAWIGHFRIERNKPATFHAPIYSLMGDYKMFFLMLLGKMDEEVKKTEAEMAARRSRP